jgi:hypothetical protein
MLWCISTDFFCTFIAEDMQVSGPKEQKASLSDDIGRDLQVPEDHGLLETLHVEATKTEEELGADALLLQQHIGNDVPSVKTESVASTKPVVSYECFCVWF